MNKYLNKKVIQNGIKFDSKRERDRWMALTLLQMAGKISDLKRQVKFVIAPSCVMYGKKQRERVYNADFTYVENGVLVVEDSKSPYLRKNNSTYSLKRHLMKTVHGVDILET